jgi:chromatin remodeling complex protein RSC6
MQTRSGNVYTYNLARPTLEKKVEPKVEKKVAPKVEKKVAPKVEPKVEPNVNNSVKTSINSTGQCIVSVNGSRVISGFLKPRGISDELAKFLNVPVGCQMLRTHVSKLINTYIRVNNLQDANNGRIINADAKLRKLLNITPTDQLTYFNINSYMRPHFIKEELSLQDEKRNKLLSTKY